MHVRGPKNIFDCFYTDKRYKIYIETDSADRQNRCSMFSFKKKVEKKEISTETNGFYLLKCEDLQLFSVQYHKFWTIT